MKQPLQLSMALLLALALMGCGLIRAAVQANEADRLEQLEAAGDYEALSETCRKPQRYKACEAKRRVGHKRLVASGCDDLVDNVKKYYRNHDANKDGDVTLVKKFHQCKLTDELFARPFRIRWKSHALAQLDERGVDVFDRFISYLANNKQVFGGQGGLPLANDIARWLVDVGDSSRCQTVHEHLDHIAPESHGKFLWFYYEAGCGEQAVPMALERLSANQHNQRIQACDVLGKLGDGATVDKLRILAETDPYKEEREVRTHSGVVGIELFFPVRERCQAAEGKVRLRG